MGKKPLTQPLIEHEEAAYGAVLNESSACASADMSLVTLASEQEEETVVRFASGGPWVSRCVTTSVWQDVEILANKRCVT